MTQTQDDISKYMQYVQSQHPEMGADDAAKYEQYLRSQPGNSPENPKTESLFSDAQRTGIGFGDPQNAAYQGYKQGFKNTQMDKDGNVLVQTKDGKYYKDANNFFPSQWSGNKPVTDLSSAGAAAEDILKSAHPINWLESNAGPAVRGTGWLAGGTVGAGLGGLEGPAAIPGATVGAGLGSAAGEAARQMLGRQMGVYHADPGSDQAAQDIATQGAKGAATELGGRAFGEIPLGPMSETVGANNIGDLIGKVGSKVIAAPSYLAMGGAVPYSDVARVAERPQGVSAAGERGYGLETAQKMETELEANLRGAKEKIQNAQGTFRNQFGDQTPNMDQGLKNSFDFLEKHAPNELGDSRLSDPEYDELLKETQLMGMGNGNTLLTQRQRLGESLPGKAYEGSVSQRTPVTSGQLQRMGGDISDSLHALDPEGLGVADKEFSQTMGQAKTLRPVETENQEGVVNSIWGKNNTARQQAAEKLTPDTYNSNLLDLRAKQGFDNAGAFGATNKEAAARGVIGSLIGGGTMAATHSTPEAAAAAAAFLAGTSPKVNYGLMQLGGRSLQAAPAFGLYNAVPSNPWAIKPDQEEDDSQ